jgi:hypothetical protein
VHTTRIQLLQFTRRTVPSDSQRVHKKLVPFAQGDRMGVSSEFHAYVVSAEKITNRHDPTCFDVVDVGTRIFEEMSSCSSLNVAPIELDKHHLARLALLLPKVTQESRHLIDAVFHI